MKLLHDGRMVLVVLDAEPDPDQWTDLTVFAGTPKDCQAEIERLGLAITPSVGEKLAETDDDRIAWSLLRKKSEANAALKTLDGKLSAKAADAVNAAEPARVEAKAAEDIKP